MMSCIRCQVSSDDGYQRVNTGLCPTCARTLSAAVQVAKKSQGGEAHLALDLAIDR